VVVLFATAPTTSAGAQDGNGYIESQFLQKHNIHRILIDLQNDAAGTIKCYQSLDRGVTWVQVYPDQPVAASVANSTNQVDLLCEPFRDFKVTWTNGATPQTTFRVNVVGLEQRVVAN
jgi:hypothetical protein